MLKRGGGTILLPEIDVKPLNILLAEDNPDDVFILREAFRKAGVTLSIAVVCDGVEVMSYLRGEPPFESSEENPFPDVLLLDLNMPRMNGFEVLESIRQDPDLKRLVVYIMTASIRESDVSHAYELGATSYLVKPVRLNDMVAFATALSLWHQHVRLAPRQDQMVHATLQKSG